MGGGGRWIYSREVTLLQRIFRLLMTHISLGDYSTFNVILRFIRYCTVGRAHNNKHKLAAQVSSWFSFYPRTVAVLCAMKKMEKIGNLTVPGFVAQWYGIVMVKDSTQIQDQGSGKLSIYRSVQCNGR